MHRTRLVVVVTLGTWLLGCSESGTLPSGDTHGSRAGNAGAAAGSVSSGASGGTSTAGDGAGSSGGTSTAGDGAGSSGGTSTAGDGAGSSGGTTGNGGTPPGGASGASGATGDGGAAAGSGGSSGTAGTPGAFVHPGLLFQRADLERMRDMVAAGMEPYVAGWNRLRTDSRTSLDYTPAAFAVVVRDPAGGETGNVELRADATRAFFHATAWVISENEAHAMKSVEILNAWSSTLTALEGGDRFLAAGLYGYLLANAGEILRYTYPGFVEADAERLERMLVEIFYPLSHEFLVTHAGSRPDHHYTNWDAAQMVNIASIGIFSNNRALYDEGVDYFFNGIGNGNIMRAVYDGETGQLQESGRDQAHAQLGIGLLASLCETAWNQGDDLYSTDDNRLLKGFEYTAAYLLGNDVPFKTYMTQSRTHTEISAVNREQRRPIYEMVLHHYTSRRGVPAPFTAELAAATRPEGFHGDHPGFGTILHTRPPEL